ncbi:MAG: hypothetical protein AB7D03_08140 [Thiomicrospira sp.]
MLINTACDLKLHDLKMADADALIDDFISQLVSRIERQFSFLNPPERTHDQEVPFIKEVQKKSFKKSLLESGYSESENNGYWLDIELMEDEDFVKIVETFNAAFSNYAFGESILSSKIFQRLSLLCNSMYFNECDFDIQSLETPQSFKPRVSFYKCNFKKNWILENYAPAYHEKSVYDFCKFEKGISRNLIGGAEEDQRISQISAKQFRACCIEGNIELSGLYFEEKLFTKTLFKNANLIVKNCEFKSQFELSPFSSFKNVHFYGSIFHSTFKASLCQFEGEIKFSELEFLGSAVFTNSSFNSEKAQKTKAAIFENIAFVKGADFGATSFLSGLNINSVTFGSPPSFSGLGKICPENTSREAFRLIKFSLDSIGNHVDANRYFAYEMKKYKQELQGKWWNSGEALVFTLNEKISDFGQSYWKPIGWIALMAIFYSFLLLSIEKNMFFETLPIDIYNYFRGSYIVCFWQGVNVVISTITPVNKFLIEGFELISILFNVVFSVLIWQAIVSVKRLTKR